MGRLCEIQKKKDVGSRPFETRVLLRDSVTPSIQPDAGSKHRYSESRPCFERSSEALEVGVCKQRARKVNALLRIPNRMGQGSQDTSDKIDAEAHETSARIEREESLRPDQAIASSLEQK